MCAWTVGLEIKGTLIWRRQRRSKPYQRRRISGVTVSMYIRVQALKFALIICAAVFASKFTFLQTVASVNVECLPVCLTQTCQELEFSQWNYTAVHDAAEEIAQGSPWQKSSTAQMISIIEVRFQMYPMTTCHFLIHESSSGMLHSVTFPECLDVVSLGRELEYARHLVQSREYKNTALCEM